MLSCSRSLAASSSSSLLVIAAATCTGSSAAVGMVQPITRCSRRHATTGEDSHAYEPGPITKAVRAVVIAFTPSGLRKRMALRMQAGLERVEVLEKEDQWLRKHGSPLQVMGLPEHAEMPEVRARYRELVLETHPDTNCRDPTSKDRDEYAILQSAYKMAMNPKSLFHQNGGAPMLLHQLRPRRLSSVTWFAIAAYLCMGAICCVFTFVVCRQAYEQLLAVFDPDFYSFMIEQEKAEAAKVAAGEQLNKDPERYAPTQLMKVLHPGRFIHGDDFNPEPAPAHAKKFSKWTSV